MRSALQLALRAGRDEVLGRPRIREQTSQVVDQLRPAALGLEHAPRQDQRAELARRELDLLIDRQPRELDELAVNSTSTPVSANRSETWSSDPHSSGGCTKSAAAADARRRFERTLPSRHPAPTQTRPADRPVVTPVPAPPRPRDGEARTCTRTPTRQRRSSHRRSAAPRRRPRPTAPRRRLSARCEPTSSSSGVRSTPTTRAPACAARSAALPVPHATSSTSSPRATAAWRTIRSPNGHS